MILALLFACGRSVEIGGFEVDFGRDGALSITHPALGLALDDVRLLAGTGSADITMSFGSFRFDDVELELIEPARWTRPRGRFGTIVVEARDADGEELGILAVVGDDRSLLLEWSALEGYNRVGFRAPCSVGEPFLGLGSHAQDVDHAGEAFGVWVSEPGIGKTDGESYPPDWFLTGTKHATSFPVPFVLRPEARHGLLVDTATRLDVDLCATDPDAWQVAAWTPSTIFTVLAGEDALSVVQTLTSFTGRLTLPPPWVFGPWNDAVRGPERVREVALALRTSGAPSTAIWTEDWRGASQTAAGYHLSGEWSLDPEKYPDAEALAAELEADGFKWLAYFSPFVRTGTAAFDEAVADGVLIRDEAGDPYLFSGVAFEPESMLDLTDPDARAWAQERMQAAIDLGFDGWMADYAEWLPVDAVLSSNATGLDVHNRYPELWQRTNAELLDGTDTVFFVRSGWTRTAGLVPVVWAGDQRTSFDADDGFPTVIPLGLGLSASGVPVFTHDVAGYQSVGNPASTKELWMRWASLGAFSPILRTHHGAFDTANVAFDDDEETLAHWAFVATEHMRLWPYRYGLAAKAADDGTPMLLPVAFRHDAAWDRTDAWLLGDLLVAPVLEAGATGRHVDLPADTTWYDWWTGEPVSSGVFAAAVDEIPVFAASGTTVPLFDAVPDTLVASATATDLDDVDDRRVVRVFGPGGPFTEADGTSYAPSGAPSAPGEATATLIEGTIDVNGLSLQIRGPRERTYTVRVAR